VTKAISEQVTVYGWAGRRMIGGGFRPSTPPVWFRTALALEVALRSRGFVATPPHDAGCRIINDAVRTLCCRDSSTQEQQRRKLPTRGSTPSPGSTGRFGMPQNKFRRGFLDGWSSIRGSEPAPSIPACSVEPGTDAYRAGVTRGVQAAQGEPPADETAVTDTWLDNALRRPHRPRST
jgi:hypothetical protein